MYTLRILFVAAAASVALGSSAVPDQDWGYVDVRTGAHMFWWLVSLPR